MTTFKAILLMLTGWISISGAILAAVMTYQQTDSWISAAGGFVFIFVGGVIWIKDLTEEL